MYDFVGLFDFSYKDNRTGLGVSVFVMRALGVLRRKDYIDNVNTLSKMYSDRKQRILSCVKNRDSKTLGNEILFDDLFVLSIVDANQHILEIICHDGWYTGFKILFSAILHRNILNENSAPKMLNKYALTNDVSDNSRAVKLWGLEQMHVKKRVGSYYKILKDLISCKFVDIKQSENGILWHCCIFGASQIVLDILIERQNDLEDTINVHKRGLTPLQVFVCENDSSKMSQKDLKLYYKVIEQFLSFKNINVDCQIKGTTTRFTQYKIGYTLFDVARYKKDEKLKSMLQQRKDLKV